MCVCCRGGGVGVGELSFVDIATYKRGVLQHVTKLGSFVNTKSHFGTD